MASATLMYMGYAAAAGAGYSYMRSQGKAQAKQQEAANKLQTEKNALAAKNAEADSTTNTIIDLEDKLESEAATLSPEEQMAAAAGAPRRTNPVMRTSLLSQDAERRKRSLLAQ